MVAIVAALFDEVWELIKRLKIDKSSSVPHYRGQIAGVDVALLLIKPGFRKKKEFRRFMQANRFERLINIGFAGALRPGLSLGQVCRVVRVIPEESLKGATQASQGLLEATESGLCAVEASEPVFSFDDKEELYLRSRADLVDMESAPLLRLTAELNQQGLSLKPEIIKIIGDVPGDEKFLKKEQLMRAWFSAFGWRKKLPIALKTGWSFFPLYFRKRKLQQILFQALQESLAHPPKPARGAS